MRNFPAPDTGLAHRLFREIHDSSFDGVGVTREAYGPGERRAHALVRQEAEALGLESATDHAGNLYLTLPGRDRAAKRLVIGSHLDSVPQGGDYDGTAGVLAGLATVAGMRRAGFVPERDIVVLVTRAEEAGAWFAYSFPGSRAALGTLPPEALAVRRQDSGRTLEDHMREEGFDPDACRAGLRVLSAETVAAFLEVHIEQGPVLDGLAVPVGVVSGIPGSRRYRAARVFGEYNHSGATPRRYRRDAAVAAAELAYRLDAKWAAMEAEGHALVCTFCVLATTDQAAFTKIAGEAHFQLDMRSVDHAALDLLHAELELLIAEIGSRRGVRFDLGPQTGSAAWVMDATLRVGLMRAAEEAGVGYHVMASGGGHDAAAFGQAGVPAAMLFIRNQKGSHNPEEAMRLPDFDQACDVVMQWAAA
jgi:beta-ureidopropionase / N-carbamoyl-L-amino-acid hydrolase